jgi:hypothetical protein
MTDTLSRLAHLPVHTVSVAHLDRDALIPGVCVVGIVLTDGRSVKRFGGAGESWRDLLARCVTEVCSMEVPGVPAGIAGW